MGKYESLIGIAGAFYFIAPVITSMMDAMMNSKEVTMPGGKKIKTAKAVFRTRPCFRKMPAAKISKPINEPTIGK